MSHNPDQEIPEEVEIDVDLAPEVPPAAEEGEVNWKDVAYRATAELDNYRKRMARERLDIIQNANAGLLEDLLPVIDNFRMGLDAARQEGESSVVYVGMNMVKQQLDKFLAENGVTEIPAQGVPFDPSLHDAVSQEETEEAPDGQVLRVARAGYRLRDRMLRPASVVVATSPQNPD